MSSQNNQFEVDPFSRESIRKALRNWDAVKSLGEHILAELEIVQERRQTAGYSDTLAGRGLALRETLVAAIETMRPDDVAPEPSDKRWRPYIIINEQYVRQRSPSYILADLHISRRTYYNEQEQGMETLSNILSQWEVQALGPGNVSLEQPSTSQNVGASQTPFLAPPRPAHNLVGRNDLLAELKNRLLDPVENPVAALQGLPGVGKTTLAIALAHDPKILEHYRDGVLWVGLGRQPDVAALLGAWATALHIPTDVLERCTSHTESAQAVHAAIGMRRILLVIDDAWNVDDALAFRLGGPNCGYLLTTRLSNVALDFAGDGMIAAHELKLDQGMDLLMEFAPQVVNTEPDEARVLVEAVGGLPLALILMGRHLRQHSHAAPERRLRAALQELQESQTRLLLSQPQSLIERHPDLPPGASLSLQTIIGLSDMALDAAARQALRDLALFPPKPNTFSEEAALSIISAAPEILDILLDHGLLEYASSDRYTLHQTITDYAQMDGFSVDARQRFVAYFTEFVERDTASLEIELNNLLAALDLAYQAGLWNDLFRSLHALQPFWARRGLYIMAEKHLRRAVEAARQHQKTTFLGWMLCHLGTVAFRLSCYSEAETHLQEGLALARERSLLELEAKCLYTLGTVNFHKNEYTISRDFHQRALAISDQLGDLHGKTKILVGLGYTLLHQGEYEAAHQFCERALDLCSEIDDREGQGRALNGLGLIVWHQSNYAAAQTYFEQCYQMCRQIGSWRLEGVALHNLGLVFDDLCNYTEARNCLQKALNIFRSTSDRRNEGRTLGNLGLFSHHLGDNEASQEYSRQALSIAREVSDRAGQAYALMHLGHAHNGLSQPDQALDAYQQSMVLWRELGHDDQAMAALAGLGRTYLTLGENAKALDYVDEILKFEQGSDVIYTLDEPFRVYLTCYQVLSATQAEERARQVLVAAHTRLQELASQINDPQQRQAYLENVPSHRELVLAYTSFVDEE